MESETIKIDEIVGVDKVADQLPLQQSKIDSYAVSIEEIGQRVPIVLCRGLIIDGRHRYEAHKRIGKETIDVKKMPYKSSVEDKIKERDTMEFDRRHQTPTQLACTSILLIEEQELINNKMTVKEVSKLTTASIANINRAKYIRKNNPKYFDILYNDCAVNNSTKNGTKSLKAVKELIDEEAAKAENANRENDADDDTNRGESQNNLNILKNEVNALCIKLGITNKFSDKETLELLMLATRQRLTEKNIEESNGE